jgi:hypothetical protein
MAAMMAKPHTGIADPEGPGGGLGVAEAETVAVVVAVVGIGQPVFCAPLRIARNKNKVCHMNSGYTELQVGRHLWKWRGRETQRK